MTLENFVELDLAWVGAAVACMLACFALLVAEWKRLAVVRAVAKLTASATFVVIGVYLQDVVGGRAGWWIVVGLVLGAIGDIALLGASKRAFLVGLGAFLLGHLAYVIACATLVPIGSWARPLDLVPTLAGGAALAYLWPNLGKLRAPVIAYVAAIVAMVIGALAVPDNLFLWTGATAFFVSDLAVARDKFVGKSLANKLWGLPAYYAAQLLIAGAIAFLPPP